MVEFGKYYDFGQHSIGCLGVTIDSVKELLQGRSVDLLYTDPCWEQKWVNKWRTDSGFPLPYYLEEHFKYEIAEVCAFVNPKYCVIEIGLRNLDLLTKALIDSGFYLAKIAYGLMPNGKNKFAMVMGSWREEVEFNFSEESLAQITCKEDSTGAMWLYDNLVDIKNCLDLYIGEGRYMQEFVRKGIPVFGMDFRPNTLNVAYKMIRRLYGKEAVVRGEN